jgi:RimJ/RimL family protein N-acetyltransferase
MQHLSFMTKHENGGWTEPDAAQRRVFQEAGFSNKASLNGVIIYDGKFAGIAGFRDISWWNKSSEMGIILEPSFWGKNISTEIHVMCLSFAFEQLCLNRVEFKTSSGNTEMIGFLESILGAVKEGTLREYFPTCEEGRFMDVDIFSLLRVDWGEAKDKLNARLTRIII